MIGEAEEQQQWPWSEFQLLWGHLTDTERNEFWRTASKMAREMSHSGLMYADVCIALKDLESGKPSNRARALRTTRKLPADELFRLVNRFKARMFESRFARDFLVSAMCSWIQASHREALNALLDSVKCPRDESGRRPPGCPIPEFEPEAAKADALLLTAAHASRSLMLAASGLLLSDPGWSKLSQTRAALMGRAASDEEQAEQDRNSELESGLHQRAAINLGEAMHTKSVEEISAERSNDFVEESGDSDKAPVESFLELYAHIEAISHAAQLSAETGGEPGARIRALLDLHLNRLEELQQKPSLEMVTSAIARYCEELLTAIDDLGISNSDHKDLGVSLRAAWKRETVQALREGRSKAWFETSLLDRGDLSEFMERFQEQQSKIASIHSEIEAIRAQLAVAKYTARTALKASESRKQTEISVAQGDLETIMIDAAHRLAPDALTLDAIMEDETLHQDTNFSLEELNIEGTRAFLALVSGLGQVSASGVIISEPAVETGNAELAARAVASVEQSEISAAAEVESVHASIPAEPTAESVVPADTPGAESNSIVPSPKLEALADEARTETLLVLSSELTSEANDLQELEPEAKKLWDSIRHLEYSESKEDAQQAFRIGYEQFSQVPGPVIEAVAMHWLERGHLNVAYQILHDAKDSSLVSERVLDASLLRSAFYGTNFWPKDREAISYTQRDLNLLNHRDLEEQLDRKPSGKLVPYLLVCATLQPALFAGSETQAPTLLKLASSYFEGALKQLLSNIADFTMRGGRADLEALRNEHGQELHLAATRLREQVDVWVDVNSQRTTRWHSLRVALKILSEQAIFKPAIEAIRAGEKGDGSAVRALTNTFSSHVESRRLLDELVQQIRADGPLDHIDSQAYASFYQQVDSLVAIAQAWLLEVVPVDVKPSETSEFLERFHTQLERSIAWLSAHTPLDLEHRAGSHLLLDSLQSLQKEIRRETHQTWRFEQTDATLRLPETIARLEMGGAGVDYRLEWLATRLASPTWLNEMTRIAEKRNAHWARILVLGEHQRFGGDNDLAVDAVVAQIAVSRAELKASIERFKNLSIQAVSVDELSESEHLYNASAATEWLVRLGSLKPFVDISFLEEEVQRRFKALEKLLNSKASELEEELSQGLLVIRTRFGVDAVPDGWDARVRAALARRNLTVARELINQLQEHINRNIRLTDNSAQENADLVQFLRSEPDLYEVLHEFPNPREAGERVIQQSPGALDYSISKATFKDAIATSLEWRSRGPNKKSVLERKTYEGIAQVLTFIGFSPADPIGSPRALQDCEYSSTGDFRRLRIRIARPTLPKGFPLFEDGHSDQVSLDVIFAQGAWSLAGLSTLVERQGLATRSVLLVGAPLSPDERRAFTNFCRDGKFTIFLLDPVVLAYLATVPGHSALKAFLYVSAAWTFYNPYTKGDARQPAPPEMRFGREHDVASLVEPRGAALVYGGRQLGKTTLLHSAVHRFEQKDQSRNHAFYIRMDGLFQHAVERNTNIKERVFERLAHELVERGLLPQATHGRPAEERLQSEFQRDGSTRVLFCLDEIDSVLDKDARTNFQLVRSLVSLVNDMRQRFRVVFAGLNNVNRFRTYPNVPLEQLGRPLEVKILPASDARSLILQPLIALGYQFEEVELVDRIMAFTNCHPSLLHIFCSELVEQIARDRLAKDGLRVIRHTDLENVENSSDVRRLSGERFDMTLNLDKRYTVVVYGLLDMYGKSIGKFSVKQALDIARGWVPEEFQQMSESGFESLLQELVGLGVLREADRITHQYAMRNQSILQLIGSANDVSHKLQVAIKGLTNHSEDVLTCHAAGTDLEPSPLSLQDERQILTAKSPDDAPKYSVSVIMGSEALGLSLKGTQEGFSAINEFESGNLLSKHETKSISESPLIEPKRFNELIDTAIDNWTNEKPSVLLVSLSHVHSIDRIMDLLSIANEKAARASRLKHALRVVFLLGPRAMWSWHSNPWLTASPGEIGGIVELNRWTTYACEGLLDQQGLGVTPEQAQLLHDATEGWHSSLMKFIEVRKRKGDKVSSFNDFSKDFKAVRDMPAKDFEKFVLQTGMDAMSWSMPLATKLKEFDSLQEFSLEDLQTAIEFLDPDAQDLISPEQATHAIRWWAALRVIDANAKETSRTAGKGDRVTYRFTPGLQRAINERADAALQKVSLA